MLSIDSTNLVSGNKRELSFSGSLFLNHDPLHHALQHLVVEFERLVPGELDVFRQVVGQEVHELAIAAFIQ